MIMCMSKIIAVSNRSLCTRPFLVQMERVCKAHPKAIILREKDLPEKEYALLAGPIMELCKQYEIPCIFHTFLHTAKTLSCPNIHLPLPLLRKYQDELYDFSVVGCSIHSVEEAIEAESLGASYLTAGHIYATDCKKGVPPRGLSFLSDVCTHVSIPVYAIGGIKADEEQLKEVCSCGAKGGCVMSGMMQL